VQKIVPFLWFDNQAEEAMKFYTSIFKNSKQGAVAFYGKGGVGENGKVMSASFELEGIEFTALNGGPVFQFTPAISFFVNCGTQAEVDYYWDRLSEGGKVEQCGWLKDKFGVSWQIVPTILGEMLSDKDPKKVMSVTQAMLKMIKLNIADLKRAYENGEVD
jgi:predicted 3-demethylubiquinone-9 3-methyltransferase (glyoxalase superfamily)